MKRKVTRFLVTALVLVSSCIAPHALAQQNSNTTEGQMKQSGSEVKRAGTSAGHDVKHGRVARAGKHFGKHIGRAGKHFGRGTKKAVKHVTS
jgi:Ni/Co efflux regulator RcnB